MWRSIRLSIVGGVCLWACASSLSANTPGTPTASAVTTPAAGKAVPADTHKVRKFLSPSPAGRAHGPGANPPATDPSDIPVDKWAGRRFVLLRMPPTYQQFGYELYATNRLAKPATPISPDIELPNRRLRYERFVGRTLRATLVTKPDNEYLVRFIDESSDQPVFGKTRQHAIKGLALMDDLEAARKLFVGKTLYSHRGFYNTADSTCSSIATERVSMDLPLVVTDIVWGVSPMPPQVLWVQIVTPDKKAGFVPICYSWTNVMADSRKKCRPWQEDLLEQNPATQYKWDQVSWQMVNEHKVGQEMTPEQVWLSWGEPLARDSVNWQGKRCDRWTYLAQHVVFADGRLAATEAR